MNNDLAPKYTRSFNNDYVLWYEISNSYSIIDHLFYTLLEIYFNSIDLDDFKTKLRKKTLLNDSDLSILIYKIEKYLSDCNKNISVESKYPLDLDIKLRYRKRQYKAESLSFSINYSSELVEQLIHPLLSHLETPIINEKESHVYDIHLIGDRLAFYKNGICVNSYPKKDYHLIQGKFIAHFLCAIYEKEEHDWLGTFHASTVTDGNSAIMCIGESGKGKSTLTALLATKGFYLLADDVSPMLSENLHIYKNPAAVSIKKGAVDMFKSAIKNIKNLPSSKLNPTKGVVKYIPFPNQLRELHYPCKTIVSVNYKKSSKTELKPLTIKDALEILIPDTWLSPRPKNAKRFLDWLETVSFYKLTYSDIDDATHIFTELFASQNNIL